MLTTPHLPLKVHTRSDAASDRGPRDINADAVATHTDEASGRMAFVVADGVGDHLLAARAARLSASTAAAQAVRHGAVGGLLRAQQELLAQFEQPKADAVLVVAVFPPEGTDEETVDIAWVGDCRAYRWNGRVLHQITVDHTLAEFWRRGGVEPSPRLEHMVTDSVRTAKESDIGRARVGAGPGRLVLSSDGVHKLLDLVQIKGILADGVRAGDTANALVTAARTFGSRDNATAIVVDRLLL
ncbi:PP2C family protein-serine/threonine phosphatase [Prauserella flavalba]|uniref:Serine/threonine protein phosphatase n=1 Tax=Prauserella flavalba TaxID=1477506 RepID=A0A318LK94_9PSEU|nr:serine/threonine protein phosphatase [Prauserella flavalba]PXY33867.1 serine/threonine protein phosphatase [Prauserella flavalba]